MLSSLNYIDLLIFLMAIFFIWEGARHGFFVVFVDFLSFLGSLLVAISVYKVFSGFLLANFSLSTSVSRALSFLIVAILSEFILGFVLGRLVSFLPKKIQLSFPSRLLSILPALGEVAVITTFLSTLLLAFPVRPEIKDDLVHSLVASQIVQKTQGLESKTNEIFGGVIEETITYLTIEPGSNKKIVLNVEVGELKEDETAESELYDLVSKEREKVGIEKLRYLPEVVVVARARAKDMWERKYFGHITPEGKNAGGYLDEAKIKYFMMGENIALAPNVSIAHIGLMNSEGHRENILSKEFTGVGIGVVDNGVYGKMFVQIFTR